LTLSTLSHPLPVCQVVKLQADLSAAALSQKLSKELALWYCLRAINQPFGDGILPLDIAMDRLISDFHFSRATAYRQLLHSKGKVLDLVPSKLGPRIKIYGLSQIIRCFGITKLAKRHWRLGQASDFDGYAKRNAQLYASLLPPKGIKGTPLSRETISKLTRLHKMQQRRYEIIARVKRDYNPAFIRVDGPLGGPGYIPIKQEIFTRVGGIRSINKRLGNGFHTRQLPGSRGMLSKVRTGIDKSSVPQEAHHLFRTYFWSFKKLIHTLTRRTRIDKTGFYLINPRNRIIKGRLEWCLVSC